MSAAGRRGPRRFSRAGALVAAALLVLVAAPASGQAPAYPDKTWARAASPEQLGFSSEKLTTTRYNVHSIRKSFLSALYGIHVREGRIDLARTLADLGIDDHSPLTPVEKRATVGDLLKARSGVYHPALYETPGMAVVRPARGSYPPGLFWYYNNWDFNVLGTILEQATKTSIAEEFQSRLAEPLEMEDFRLEDSTYVRGPDSMHPAYPFRMTARDMARFGLLYLRGGQWRGRAVVPLEWVEESTRSFSDVGQSGGYGYLWWVAPNGGPHFTSAYFKGASTPRRARAATTSSWCRTSTSSSSIASTPTSRAASSPARSSGA